MSALSRRSQPADREVEISVDDFRLTGLLTWDATAHDYDLCDVYLHQNGKSLLVDDPDKLGALHEGAFLSFSTLLRWHGEEV